MKSSIFSVEMGRVFGNSSHNSPSFGTVVGVVKVVLIAVGVVSSVILLKISVIPSVSSFLVSTLPCLWSFFRSFLSPPYIYILLNFIILTIAASSKKPQTAKTAYPIAEAPDDGRFESLDRGESRELDVPVEAGAAEPLVKEPSSHLGSDIWGRTYPISRESSADVKEMISEPQEEPRNPGKPENPREAEEPVKAVDPDDTYESIWKLIHEKPPPPPQFKRSSTWDTPPQVRRSEPEPEPEPGPVMEPADTAARAAGREMRKSNTFKENTGPGKLLSKDELNLRSEAFIKHIKLAMRLQREESDQRFTEMVNRAK